MQSIKQYANGCVCLGRFGKDRGRREGSGGVFGRRGENSVQLARLLSSAVGLMRYTHRLAHTHTHCKKFQMSSVMAVWPLVCESTFMPNQ